MWRANLRPFVLGSAFLAVSGAITAFSLSLHFRTEESAYIQRHLVSLTIMANIKAEGLRDFHKERLIDLSAYAAMLDIPNTGPDALRRLAPLLKPLLESGKYDNATVSDARGRILVSLPPGTETGKPDTGPAGPPHLHNLRRSPSGTPILEYEAALHGGNRLLLRVRSDAWLTPLITHWPGIEKTGDTLLYKREGDALIALNNFKYKQDSSLNYRIPLDADIIAARFARGQASPMKEHDYRGVECFAIVRTVPELGWILVAKADVDEILAPARRESRLTAIATFILFAFLTVMLTSFLRYHTDRLHAEANADKFLITTAIEQVSESVIITDKDACVIYINPAFIRASGYTRAEMRGKTPRILKSGRHDKAFYMAMWDILTQGKVWSGRLINKRKNGTLYEEDVTITPVRGANDDVTHYVGVKRDISAVKSLEDQLLHSQKMEAIGRLAGGIAHDFNNILTTINGYTEMLSDTAPENSPLAADLAEILGAGRRAALLTRQLLTFSRRAPADAVDLDLRATVHAIEKLLRRILGEDIRLTLDIQDEPIWIHSDPEQINQVLMNLSVNASDAMPKGGELSIRTCVTEFETEKMRMLGTSPAGRYATIIVRDNGSGMEGPVLERLFEPFFTTKEKGKGSGLGLSIVFGIVKQNKGHITVDSAPDRGSTFTVYLPLIKAPDDKLAPTRVDLSSAHGDETILIAEDQDAVLRMIARTLTAHGYRVISCASGEDALAKARELNGPLHLLLTDVIMPGMGGVELSMQLHQARPQTRVLYMSGYTDGRLDDLNDSGEKIDLMLKPFSPEQVCRRVRDALDGAAPRMG